MRASADGTERSKDLCRGLSNCCWLRKLGTVALRMLSISSTANQICYFAAVGRKCIRNAEQPPSGTPNALLGSWMSEKTRQLGPREQQITALLLQGCDNAEIAMQLKMAPRTVKAHFNRLFLRFGIRSGIKRVKLATLLYRRELCQQNNSTEPELQVSANSESLPWLPKDSKTVKSLKPSAPPSTSSKTTSASSTISWGS